MSALGEQITVLNPQQPTAQRIPERLALFERLCKQIPANDFGLPRYLFRADLIPDSIESLPHEERIGYLAAASIDISYREGFPTLENGNALWGQMETENDEDFILFKNYLEQLSQLGYRQISLLEEDVGLNNPSFEHLRECFTYNFWATRAKAHDLFIAAAHKRLREQRLLRAENSQYLQSESLLKVMEAKMKTIFSDEKLEAIEPDKAVKMLRDLYRIQGEALGAQRGVTAGKRDAANEPPANASMEVTLRSIARSSGSAEVSADDASVSGNNLEILNRDSATVGMAQELIIRLQMGATTGSKKDPYTIDPELQFTSEGQAALNNADPDAWKRHQALKASVNFDEREAEERLKRIAERKAERKGDDAHVPIDELDREMIGQ